MGSKAQTFRVTAISGANSNENAVGGKIDMVVQMLETYPAGRITPTLAYDKMSVKVSTKFSEPVAQPDVSAQSPVSVDFTLLAMDNSSAPTVSVASCLPNEWHMDGDSHPHGFEIGYMFDAGDSENFQPITAGG